MDPELLKIPVNFASFMQLTLVVGERSARGVSTMLEKFVASTAVDVINVL